MNKAMLAAILIGVSAMLFIPQLGQADQGSTVFRHSNFSNEFKISTPEGINARGTAEVKSRNSRHGGDPG
ncbi:MAG: hypothetical protein K0U68_04170 [Gammaproteobacteria bacterium]|nr:hypothetical protein [Gammaproteobacteria bacterium]